MRSPQHLRLWPSTSAGLARRWPCRCSSHDNIYSQNDAPSAASMYTVACISVRSLLRLLLQRRPRPACPRRSRSHAKAPTLGAALRCGRWQPGCK